MSSTTYCHCGKRICTWSGEGKDKVHHGPCVCAWRENAYGAWLRGIDYLTAVDIVKGGEDLAAAIEAAPVRVHGHVNVNAMAGHDHHKDMTHPSPLPHDWGRPGQKGGPYETHQRRQNEADWYGGDD